MIPISKRRREQSNTHERAPLQERELATQLGGKVTKGSGNQQEKGDIRIRGVSRIECKNTQNSSFSIGVEHVLKLEKMAMTAGEVPFMQVDLQVIHGVPKASFCVLPTYFLEECVSALKQLRELKERT